MANVKDYKLKIDIKKDGEMFLATCPDWNDCYAQGKTIDEATSEIISVASGLVELYEEEDLAIPLKRNFKAVSYEDKVSFSVPVFAMAQ